MEYQQRITIIAQALNRFLRRYAVPSHLVADDETRLVMLREIADEINGYIAADAAESDVKAVTDAVLREVARSCRSKDWPLLSAFSKASKSQSKERANSRSGGEESEKAWKPDPIKIAADRMNNREPVGDNAVFGRLSKILLDRGMVSEQTMAEYRRGALEAMTKVYGNEKARRLIAERQRFT